MKQLRRSLLNAGSREKCHHRHIHAQVNRDPVLQLDRHQGVQSQIAQGLLYVQLGCGQPEHTSH